MPYHSQTIIVLNAPEPRLKPCKKTQVYATAVATLDFSNVELLDDVVELNPYIDLQFRVADIISNTDDVKVVCDAAYWCAEGDGDGPLVTLDRRDLVDNEAEINETLVAEQGEAWRLDITVPMDVPIGETGPPAG